MKASRLHALAGLVAALLIGPLAGSAHAQAPRESVIGVIYPLSGNLAQLGIDSVTAIRPELGQAEAERLISEAPAEQLLMPWTGVRFDEKGQNAGVRAILQPIQKGAYATIYPFDLASADVAHPLPGYKEKK